MKIVSIFEKCKCDSNFKTKFQKKLEKDYKEIRYDRQFLLEIAKYHLCSKFPPNWDQVVLENPDVIKKVQYINLQMTFEKGTKMTPQTLIKKFEILETSTWIGFHSTVLPFD